MHVDQDSCCRDLRGLSAPSNPFMLILNPPPTPNIANYPQEAPPIRDRTYWGTFNIRGLVRDIGQVIGILHLITTFGLRAQSVRLGRLVHVLMIDSPQTLNKELDVVL